VVGLSEENPADVGPPSAVPRRVGVSGLIGSLMVDSVRGHPEEGAAFKSQSAANREEVLERQRYSVRAVGVQAVIPHAYAESNRHPIQKNRDDEGAPTEHEESGDGSHVE